MSSSVSTPRRLIRVSRSKIHGRGVYARLPIPDGTRIIEYKGERVSKTESERRETARLERQAKGGDGSVYLFVINKRFDIDGRIPGNLARWINHSCKPNCRAEIIQGRVWIIARREIQPGEELYFDYGYGYDEWRKHPCRCGEKGCVGYIVNSSQRWRVRRILREEKRAARLGLKASRETVG